MSQLARLLPARGPAPVQTPDQSHARTGEGGGTEDLAELETQVREALDDLCESFGEHNIGGRRHPRPDHRFHQERDVKAARTAGLTTLKNELKRLAPQPGPKRLQVLIYLYNKSWELWDLTLAYNTLNVVEQAVADFVDSAVTASDRQSAQDWDPALRAVHQAFKQIIADTDIFKAINLSSAKDLETAAIAGVETTETIASDVKSLGPSPWNAHDDTSLRGDLAGIAEVARQSHIFYAAIAGAAAALIEFESWLAAASRLGSAQPDPPAGGSSGAPTPTDEPLASIKAAVDKFTVALKAEGKDKLDALTRERAEPWLRLLVEVQEIVDGVPEITASGDASGPATVVFVPKRVSIRYCYPFTVGTNEPIRPLLKNLRKQHVDDAFKRKPKEAYDALLGIKANEASEGPSAIKASEASKGLSGVRASAVNPLAATQFFVQDAGLYGGVRVDLPDIEFIKYPQLNGVDSDNKPERCKVWLDLSDMGNHCLCIQPAQLNTPLPHLLYRAVRAGIPSSRGETVDLARAHADDAAQPQPDTETGWDSLYLFSRDVIESIALADFWKHGKDTPRDELFERGNLHEIIVVRTEEPLGTYAENIAKGIDGAVGGKILLRSIQRTATTLEEWIQYPRQPGPGSQGRKCTIEGIPEMGLDGDWCTHTGETTVFGIVAAPSWHYAVYVEGAQFVSSWNPLLRLWSRRLRHAIEASQPGAIHLTGSEKLRPIEKQVHLHLMQISAEELCATQAHRRFLDQLLDMSQLKRLQVELESELTAAEHLTDWIDEEQHKRSEKRRVVLLGVLALLGIFGLSGFVGFANTTDSSDIHQGAWEDLALVAVFLAAVIAGIRYDIFEINDWMRRPFVRMVPALKRFSRTRSDRQREGAESGE